MIGFINSDYQTQQQFGILSNHLQNIPTTSIQNQSVQHNQINNMYKIVCRNIKVGGSKKSRCTTKTKEGKRCKHMITHGKRCGTHHR